MLILVGACAFACVALAVLLILRLVSAPRALLLDRVATLAADDMERGRVADPRMLRLQNYSKVPWLQRRLQGTARAERIADDLDRAALPLRVGEFLSLSALGGVVFAVLAYAWIPEGVLQVLITLLAFVLGILGPRWFVGTRVRRRRSQFEAQLPEALDILSRSIRAGNGLLIAIDSLVEQMPGVVGDEFGRMRQEIVAGLSVDDALQELDRRMESRDLHIVVTAFLIQREVGGNLTEILDNVSSTMRQRTTLRREVRVLNSQQRFGAYIVAAVPPGIVLMMLVVSPAFIKPLFDSAFGIGALFVAVGLELGGILALKLVTSFEV